MTQHQAIWYDADGYIANQQAGHHIIYDTVSLDDTIINMQDIIIPTGETNLPEGWPIYRLAQSIVSVAINPQVHRRNQ